MSCCSLLPMPDFDPNQLNTQTANISVPSLRSISSLEPPSMASGWILPPSHFSTSLYQFLTRLEGDTTTAFSISGLQSGLCRRSVHMRVMHCRVLPSPISSAMIQPWLPGIRRLVTQSQRNFTPCQEIVLSEQDEDISRVTTSLPQCTGLTAQQTADLCSTRIPGDTQCSNETGKSLEAQLKCCHIWSESALPKGTSQHAQNLATFYLYNSNQLPNMNSQKILPLAALDRAWP